MIRTLTIHNYKSIDQLEFELGRVNVFIGENGCGKTNILEALALAAASAAGKLENEFLLSRGIRATEPARMRSGFTTTTAIQPIRVTLQAVTPKGAAPPFKVHLQHDNSPYGQWADESAQDLWRSLSPDEAEAFKSLISTNAAMLGMVGDPMALMIFAAVQRELAQELGIDRFLIYTPTEDALRDLSRESNVEPIGLHGEGLFKLLSNLSAEQLADLKHHLGLIHWFGDLQVLSGAAPGLNAISIVDQYLGEGIAGFDQRSANEGFLFILLYAALLVSSHTPKFFAIDNVDTALNPKLSAGVIKMFVDATRQHDRQVLLTTHNPGALDGLDLQDPEQRLFVVYRNIEGRTRVRRILRQPGDDLPRLSEAFLQGHLGGLPNHF